MKSRATFSLMIVLAYSCSYVTANWDAWWTYEGISGPAYWGLINPSWTMCNKVGKENIENVNQNDIHRAEGNLQ